MHIAGKTDEARADLARLAIIRKQREEAAKKRDASPEWDSNSQLHMMYNTDFDFYKIALPENYDHT
jgi:hypothetical protein